MPKVLLFNIHDADKRMKIRVAALRAGLEAVEVGETDLARPIGSLFGREGFAPAEEADSEYIAPADDTPASSGGSSGGAAAGKSDRDIVSENYPYRRVLMHPEPGIRAEAAGTLLWPLPSSPFQQLLNN